MINPQQFARSGDDTWASALRVAALVVEAGKGRSVEFLGHLTPRILEDGSTLLYFRMLYLPTGERFYLSERGDSLI